MSTNTIGWDTPIGNYAGGKQGFLHPTGLLELRRPGSATRMAEIKEAADYEFKEQDTHQCSGLQRQEHKKSPPTLPAEILVEILERTSPATLHFSCRRVSKVFRKWSEYFLRSKLRLTLLATNTYSGKSRRPCALVTACRLATSYRIRRLPAQLTDDGTEYGASYATERQKSWLMRNVRLPWQCKIVAVQLSIWPELENLQGRGLIFYSELPYCPLRGSENRLGWHKVRELVLLGQWIEELRIHSQRRQAAEVQQLLGKPFFRYSRRLDVLSRLLPGNRPWLKYGLLGTL